MRNCHVFHSWTSRLKLLLTAVLITVSSTASHANHEGLRKENCIGDACFGPVFIYLEGAPLGKTDAIGQFACRIFGLNTTSVDPQALMEDASLRKHPTLILFLNDLYNVSSLHPHIRPPPTTSRHSTQFGGRFSFEDGTPPSNVLVLDQERIGCHSPRCILGAILQYLEWLHDYKFVIDQDRYDAGDYCD